MEDKLLLEDIMCLKIMLFALRLTQICFFLLLVYGFYNITLIIIYKQTHTVLLLILHIITTLIFLSEIGISQGNAVIKKETLKLALKGSI